MRHLRALLFGLWACQPTAAPHAVEPEKGRIDDKWRDFIKTEKIVAVPAPAALRTTGRVTFDEDHTQRVGAPLNGRVANVFVNLGDRVKSGQPLLELSSPEVAQLQSDVKKSQQDVQIAQKTWERTRSLRDDGAVSDKEAAEAAAAFEKARAEVERGEAQLAALGLRASDPAVRAALFARIQSTVVERHVGVGQEVRADSSTPLFILTNLDTVWVLADVYEPDLSQVAAGGTVTVRVVAYPHDTFAGKIGYIGDVVDPQSRTVKVRCVVPNPEHRLKPEMFAAVDLQHNGDGKVIVVPTRALVADGEHMRVLVVGSEQRFAAREVQVGQERDGKRHILSGLQEGETIVTEGALFLSKTLGE